MKFFANKSIWKKIVLILVFITVFSFVLPQPVGASIGGELMEPICDFFVALCDGVINIIHVILLKQDLTLVSVNLKGSLLSQIARVAATIGAVLGIALLIAVTAGGAAVGIAAIVGTSLKIAAVIGILSVGGTMVYAGLYVGIKVYRSEVFLDEVDIPVYTISPEEIFKNAIPIFNVNFFNPDESAYISPYVALSDYVMPDDSEYYAITEYVTATWVDSLVAWFTGDSDTPVADEINEQLNEYTKETTGEEGVLTFVNNSDEENIYIGIEQGTLISSSSYSTDDQGSGGTYYYFIITEGNYAGTYKVNSTGSAGGSWGIQIYRCDTVATRYGEEGIYALSKILSETISQWYWVLLTLAVVAMLSVLVYVGIRILISSTSAEKAKYKQMLGDWLVGMILLFTLHFIMVFANTFVESLTEFITTSTDTSMQVIIVEDDTGRIETQLSNAGFTAIELDDSSEVESTGIGTDDPLTYVKYTEDGVTVIEWHTNLMGRLRFDLMTYRDADARYIGYTVLFIMMVLLTLIFIYTYIKRVIIMAFLTIIAPLVAVTYPIDKANDGSAQGFNMWFKEYIFNLLLQPMHLLLYTVLVSTAIELAVDNPIYSIVALGFMVPAEKLLRQMFNFTKAQTPGVFGGAAGAALAMSGIRWLTGHGPHGGKGGSERDADKKEKDEDGKVSYNSGKYKMSDYLSDGPSERRENATETSDSSGQEDSDGFNVFNLPGLGQRYTDEELASMDYYGNRGSGTDGNGTGRNGTGTPPRTVTPASNNRQTGKVKRKPIRSAAGFYKDALKKKFKRSIQNKNPVRGAGRIFTKALGGAALGMFGLASGAITGDASKAAQNTGVGFAAGAKLSGNAFDSTTKTLTVDGVGEEYERSSLGEEEYKKVQAERNKEKLKKDEQFISKYRAKLNLDSREEAKKGWSDAVDFYGDQDIAPDEMINIEKASKKGLTDLYGSDPNKARARMTLGSQFVNQFGWDSKLKPKDQREIKQRAHELYDPVLGVEGVEQGFRDANIYIRVIENLSV